MSMKYANALKLSDEYIRIGGDHYQNQWKENGPKVINKLRNWNIVESIVMDIYTNANEHLLQFKLAWLVDFPFLVQNQLIIIHQSFDWI